MSHNKLTKTQLLTIQEDRQLGHMGFRLAYGINSIEDCQNAAEEVAAGFVPEASESGQSNLVNLDTHANLGTIQLNMVDLKDEVFYAVRRVSGKCSMWSIANSDYNVTN